MAVPQYSYPRQLEAQACRDKAAMSVNLLDQVVAQLGQSDGTVEDEPLRDEELQKTPFWGNTESQLQNKLANWQKLTHAKHNKNNSKLRQECANIKRILELKLKQQKERSKTWRQMVCAARLYYSKLLCTCHAGGFQHMQRAM